MLKSETGSMNRRWLLSLLAGGTTALTGCVDADPTDNSSESTTPSAESQTANQIPDPPSGGICGPASENLMQRLTDEPGDTNCPDDLYPSLVVANEREQSITAWVEFDSVEQISERFDLKAGARTVRHSVVPSVDDLVATVRIASEDDDSEDEEFTETWPSSSCKRHAVRIGSDSIDVGYVDPLSLPADGQHDCYPGDPVDVRIYNKNENRKMSVLVDDRCAGERINTELSLASGEFKPIHDVLKNGGVYDITVVLERGYVETYAYEEDCWDVGITIEAADEIRIQPVGID
jgi:hypothetical protein